MGISVYQCLFPFQSPSHAEGFRYMAAIAPFTPSSTCSLRLPLLSLRSMERLSKTCQAAMSHEGRDKGPVEIDAGGWGVGWGGVGVGWRGWVGDHNVGL